MRRKPNWETTTKSNLRSGPSFRTSYPQLPAAETQSTPQNLLRCRNSSAGGGSEAQDADVDEDEAVAGTEVARGQQPQNCPWLCPRSWIPYPLARTASCGWPADKGKPIIFSCNICKSKKLNDTNLNSTTTKTTTYAPKNVSTSHVRMYVSICTWAQDEPSKILQPKRKYPCVCACVFGSCKH